MKTVKIIVALLVLTGISALAYRLFGTYSDGYRAGTVIKLSHKGIVLKTYEGQLNLGMGIQDQHNPGVAVSNIWEFSVSGSDALTLARLDTAMMSGKRAKLHYREKYVTVPWRGDTKYQVYRVDLVE
jgi:hypothetical protein